MRSRILGLALLACAAGCSSGRGGGGGIDASASGTCFKGTVMNGTVTLFELRSTGALGPVVGTGTTGADGTFQVSVSGYTGPAIACITGGTFVDEATGATATIPTDEPLYGFVDVQLSPADFSITPLSTIAFALAQLFTHDPDATVDDSMENSYRAVENLFGLQDIAGTVPADLTAGSVAAGPAADAGIVIAGISRLAEMHSVDTTAMITALSHDASDGRFDGKHFSADVSLGAGTLPPDAGTAGLAAAIADFLAGGQNASGLTDADTMVDDVLAASSGVFDKPMQIRRIMNGYGDTAGVVDALLEALLVPPNPQVMIEARILQITSQTADELGFEIPSDLSLGMHDLVVTDQDTGIRTRVRDAIEAFDSDAMPGVTGISPPAGPVSGGSLLSVRGTNFGPGTQVEVGGVSALRLAYDFPRWMVVATPPMDAGTVDVTVRNPSGQSTVVAGGFEYREKDTRANPALPSPTAPIVFGGFRNYADMAAGLTAQAFLGRTTFANFDMGDFTLTDFTSTEAAPTIATRSRGGQAFQSTESLGKAFALFDSTNGLQDFVRGFTNEENGVSFGATAFGPAVFFPEPTDALATTLAGSYWISGIEVNVGLSTVRQKTGWVELGSDSEGSASLLGHERDYGGLGFELGSEKWSLSFTYSPTGRFQGTRTVGGASEPLEGHFNESADLGFLVQNGSDGTLGYYLLTPIERGLEAAGWGGWVGGYLQQEVVDDGMGGMETAFESGSYRGLIGDVSGGGTARLAFNRASRHTQSDPDDCFSEYSGAVDLSITPNGRLLQGDALAGFVNSYGGVLLALGEFPDGCPPIGGTDFPFVMGGAVFRDSRKSFLSLDPRYQQVTIQARLLETTPTNAQELGTDFFGVTIDAATAPDMMGVEVPLSGTIPELAAATIAGLHKSSGRDENGVVTTTRGSPPHWGVQVGFSFIDDILDLFATQVTQPGGRFDGAEMPRWIGSGTLSNGGDLAALRGSDAFLGDGLTFLVADAATTIAEPDYLVRALGLAFEPDTGGVSGVTASRTDLGFAGNGTVSVSYDSLAMWESGVFTTDVISGLGLNTAPSGQSIRLNIPTTVGPDREWETFWTPGGDVFVGIDDTPGVDMAGIVLAVRPSLTGSFVDDDRPIIGLELDPQVSQATTVQLILTPRVGSLLTGEIFTTRRDPNAKIWPAQSFVGTAASDVGPGEAQVPFLGQVPILGFLFNDRDEAFGQAELTVMVTPRISASLAF